MLDRVARELLDWQAALLDLVLVSVAAGHGGEQ
jgi:hypothetical protein